MTLMLTLSNLPHIKPLKWIPGLFNLFYHRPRHLFHIKSCAQNTQIDFHPSLSVHQVEYLNSNISHPGIY